MCSPGEGGGGTFFDGPGPEIQPYVEPGKPVSSKVLPLQYLLDWKAYGPEKRFWVSASNVLELELIQEFHNLPTKVQQGGVI